MMPSDGIPVYLPWLPTCGELATAFARQEQTIRKNTTLRRAFRDGTLLYFQPESVEAFAAERGLRIVWRDRITGEPLTAASPGLPQ